jgi:hypothetical protein
MWMVLREKHFYETQEGKFFNASKPEAWQCTDFTTSSFHSVP